MERMKADRACRLVAWPTLLGMAATAGLALPGRAHAQVTRAGAALSGRVLDSIGWPIEGADIVVLTLTTRSNALGDFHLLNIPAGTHDVRVRRVGFEPVTLQTTFSAGETLLQRFILRRVVALDSVVITGRKSPIPEFEERRARGGGHFITREELEKSPGRKMSDVLRGVPGLRVGTNSNNRSEAFAFNSRGAITMLASNPKCYVPVYIDDVAVYSGDLQSPYNLNLLSAHEIEGVEYYQGGASIPAKYNRTGSACSVLLIWTRR